MNRKNQTASLWLIPALLLAGCATPSAPKTEWKPTPAEALQGTLTLEQCLDLAFSNDVRAAQWQARLEAAKAEVDIANEIPNPSFTATWEDVGLHDAAGAHLATAAYGLAFPFLYWLSTAPPEVAEAGLKTSAATIAEDRRQLRRDVGSAYFELAAAQRREAFQRTQIDTAAESQRLTSESLRLGIVSRHAATQAGAETLQARSDLDAAARDLLLKGYEMAFALGAERPVAVRVAAGTEPSPAPLADLPTTGSLPQAMIDQALAADPSAARAAAERETAEASLRLAAEGAWPFHEINGSAERKNEPDGMGNNFALDIPLPFFNRHEGEIRKAKAELEGSRAAEEQARRDALQRTSTDWTNYLYSRRRYEETVLPLVALRRRLAAESRQLFASGGIEFIELLQAQRDLTQAELDGVDARQDYDAARWNLKCDLTPVPGAVPGTGDEDEKE